MSLYLECLQSANPHQPYNNRMRVFITESQAGTFRPQTSVGIRCRNAKQRLTATVACELESACGRGKRVINFILQSLLTTMTMLNVQIILKKGFSVFTRTRKISIRPFNF
ncbi:hypothetical protein CDAR_300011 [Caerostris darwini]|uniref:Uncharacterized protein n=1 Tax=Caerostris darwini TaxID=1538125 RepID=A0AAV4W3J7_9ARAC|nr:hypothetical protein CDAR_300011 [Caerostris darwini]